MIAHESLSQEIRFLILQLGFVCRRGWFVGLIYVARISTEPVSQVDSPPILNRTEERRCVNSSRTQNHVPAWARRIYFSNTFLICPTFFSTLPAWCSALPSASRWALSVIWPTFFLISPLTS